MKKLTRVNVSWYRSVVTSSLSYIHWREWRGACGMSWNELERKSSFTFPAFTHDSFLVIHSNGLIFAIHLMHHDVTLFQLEFCHPYLILGAHSLQKKTQPSILDLVFKSCKAYIRMNFVIQDEWGFPLLCSLLFSVNESLYTLSNLYVRILKSL